MVAEVVGAAPGLVKGPNALLKPSGIINWVWPEYIAESSLKRRLLHSIQSVYLEAVLDLRADAPMQGKEVPIDYTGKGHPIKGIYE